MNKSTVQIALSITKLSAQKGWNEEEFWEAIELIRSNKEDARQNIVETIESIPVDYSSAKDFPIMLNAQHIADALGVSLRKAYDVMDQKGFPLVKIGRRKVSPRESFFNWLEKEMTA
ncbi:MULTISPECIES: helix-turn-helix domain-containing protein [Bacillus cereus group]|uniref:DNA-binding protein n=1 Tax=Bacillus toyonensis TaxID=155322 RepID=A0A2A8H9A4_9BACI|nr:MULTISPECIES: helix-turn-helix domain-containing protein [Bacillus cereus group]PEP93975.1 DNA-binding protein [Bacillus toyonensis]QUG82377.1 helix-turn-helix domain-containing protein [Bacillus nitratireducens]